MQCQLNRPLFQPICIYQFINIVESDLVLEEIANLWNTSVVKGVEGKKDLTFHELCVAIRNAQIWRNSKE